MRIFQENKSHRPNKKILRHCANFKEEIVTLSQMNIQSFHKTTLQDNDNCYVISFVRVLTLVDKYIRANYVLSQSHALNTFFECE